jgi:hypothetical protein
MTLRIIQNDSYGGGNIAAGNLRIYVRMNLPSWERRRLAGTWVRILGIFGLIKELQLLAQILASNFSDA